MSKMDELKIRLASLQRAPIFAKPAAAEEALICTVQVLEQLDMRISKLEKGVAINGKSQGG